MKLRKALIHGYKILKTYVLAARMYMIDRIKSLCVKLVNYLPSLS